MQAFGVKRQKRQQSSIFGRGEARDNAVFLAGAEAAEERDLPGGLYGGSPFSNEEKAQVLLSLSLLYHGHARSK